MLPAWRALLFLLPALLLAWGTRAADPPSVAALQRARELVAVGKTTEGIAATRRALELVRRDFGSGHLLVGIVNNDLSRALAAAGDYAGAEKASRAAVAILAKNPGPNSVEYAVASADLATSLAGQGKYAEARDAAARAHGLLAKLAGPESEMTAQVAQNLGSFELALGRPERAVPLLEAARTALVSRLGPEHPAAAMVDRLLARAALAQGETLAAAARLEQASAVLARYPDRRLDAASVQIQLAGLRAQTGDVAGAEHLLEEVGPLISGAGESGAVQQARAQLSYVQGNIHFLRGSLVETERAYRQSLDILRRPGADPVELARVDHALALVYQELGRFDLAESFYASGIDRLSKALGSDSPAVAQTRLERVRLRLLQGNPWAGEEEAKAVLAVLNRTAAGNHLALGRAWGALGHALSARERNREAADALQRANDLVTSVRGESAGDLPYGLTELGRVLARLGDFDKANAALARSVALRESFGIAPGTGLVESLTALADLRYRQGRLDAALDLARRSTAILGRRYEAVGQVVSGSGLQEQHRARSAYAADVRYALESQKGPDSPRLTDEMFQAVQMAQIGPTMATLSQTVLRFATGSDRLAGLVRERQDAVEGWRALDRLQLDPGSTHPGETSARLASELARLQHRIQDVSATLDKEHPEYASLSRPRPASIAAIQSALRPGELVVGHLTADEGTTVWLIAPDKAIAAGSPLTTVALAGLVERLRRNLDLLAVTDLNKLTYDFAAAVEIYEALFGRMAAELADATHIIFVPDGAMQNLPPQVLLRSLPAQRPAKLADYRALDWLGHRYAISVLPGADALVALRRVARRSAAPAPFVGFGDPELRGKAGATRALNPASLFRMGTTLDLRALRDLPPLPETADELRALARSLGADESTVYLGDRATVNTVKSLPLKQYAVLAFATHGLLAGDFRGLAEPALVMTPPPNPTPADTGLLTASDVAALELDADFVILSACNTASPDGSGGAEGLSGLARAFFHAGTRAVLASHWSVSSDAAARLTTLTTRSLVDDRSLGRAEALRRALLAITKPGQADEFAHPGFWGPFVVVGEGGSGR